MNTTVPTYKTAQMAGRQSGRYTYSPRLQDRTDGRSPVREIHIQSPPTRPHRWQVAGQGDTHTVPAYKTAQMAGRRSGRYTYSPRLQDRTDGRSPVREIHIQSPPTRPHRWQVASQGDTHTVPAYKTAHMAGRQSGRYTYSPRLQDRTDGRSPVREIHIQSPPTRPHRWQVAGQGDTHTVPAYKTAQMAGRRSGRYTYSPRLQDRTDGRSPVREIHIQSPPTRPHRWQVASQGERKTHTF